MLIFLGRLKKNYPVKLALSNYYLTVAILIVSAIVLHPESLHYIMAMKDVSIEQGNAIVESLCK